MGVLVYFIKNTLTVRERVDLSFDETIVLELKFGRKKIFFTVIYRSPAHNLCSPEFDNFLSNFKNLYENIKNENPYIIVYSLPVISMRIRSFGGIRVIRILRAGRLKN